MEGHDKLIKMGIFIILLSLLAFTRGDTPILKVVEGSYIQRNLSYPCDSARVTLQLGSGVPFYDSANPKSLPLPENQELELQNETESNNCLLQLRFNPVLKSDEGGYILTPYDGDGNILEDQRVIVRVDYRPGKASCEWGEENVVDDWRSMQCKVPAKNMSWKIACYQNESRLPQINTSAIDSDIQQQTFWVRYSQKAFCCASLQDQLIDRCECDDYVWPDPLHSGNITDPCSAPRQDSRPPQSPKEDNIYPSTPSTLSSVKEIITERPVKNNVYMSLHRGIFVFLVLLIVVLFVVIAALSLKIRKIPEQRNLKDKARSDYTSVPSVEVQL